MTLNITIKQFKTFSGTKESYCNILLMFWKTQKNYFVKVKRL